MSAIWILVIAYGIFQFFRDMEKQEIRQTAEKKADRKCMYDILADMDSPMKIGLPRIGIRACHDWIVKHHPETSDEVLELRKEWCKAHPNQYVYFESEMPK